MYGCNVWMLLRWKQFKNSQLLNFTAKKSILKEIDNKLKNMHFIYSLHLIITKIYWHDLLSKHIY